MAIRFDKQSTHNFYESFSDMVFCTLVLFVVIVMALVLRVSEARVAANRFTGASGSSHFSVEVAKRPEGVYFVFISPEVVRNYELARGEESVEKWTERKKDMLRRTREEMIFFTPEEMLDLMRALRGNLQATTHKTL